MIKFSATDEQGKKLVGMVVEDSNFSEMVKGRPLCVDLEPFIGQPVTLLMSHTKDIRKTAEDLQQSFDIGKLEGDFSASPQLIAMVGLPRSGKTTIIRDKYLPFGYTSVCPDDFRLAIHGQRFVPSAEPFVWACVYASVDALLKSGNKVVIDATNVSEKRREPWTIRGAKFRIVSTSKDECISRAKAEGDEAIIPIIERQFQEMTLPGESEIYTEAR